MRNPLTPTAAMLGVDVATTILRGTRRCLIVTAVERLAAAMPGTEREVRARIGRPSSSAPQNRSMEIRDLSNLAANLEGVREQTKDGLVHWRYRGRLVARQLDDDHVVVRTEFEARDVLVRSFPDTFSVPKRFAKHMMMVANLRHGDRDAIEDAVTAAWQLQRTQGPPSPRAT